MRPDGLRDPVAGPDDGPVTPFPIRLSGPVIKGFGRGSKELGIPTANIPPTDLERNPDLKTGVYYGLAGLEIDEQGQPGQGGSIFEAVLSIGYNPFYKNTVRSVEIHLLHSFHTDFYTVPLNLLILGFIRPEYDYVSKESLIEDIRTDCDVAKASLARKAYKTYWEEERGWLVDFKHAKEVAPNAEGDAKI